MPYEDFVVGLKQLGFDIREHDGARVSFPYTVPVGKFAGKEIEVGYEVPTAFNLQAPGGPHIRPHLLPVTGGGGAHPGGGVHLSGPFGAEWQYWSRPMNHWNTTQRSVADVIAFLHRLFDTQ